MKKKNLLRKKLLLGALAFSLVGTTGCGKKADCDIEDSHAHLYTNEEGYSRYINKEYIKYEGYTRNDDYINIEGQEKFYKFLDKKDMLKIEDNMGVILAKQEENNDYIEYRYFYTYFVPIAHVVSAGKTTTFYYTYIPMTGHSWTSDSNHCNLTGEQRLCHYVYTAYKIEKDDNGKYVLIPSKDVDNIKEVMDEYPYIKEKYYKVVNPENGCDLDYEDGPEEEISPEELEEIKQNLDSSQNNNINRMLSLKQSSKKL